MTRENKSFRRCAILVALIFLAAVVSTMAAREQTNLGASYSFLNAYDSNGAMLNPAPKSVANDLSASQLGGFNIGEGASWTTVGPYFGIDVTNATGTALSSANSVRSAYDALPAPPADPAEVPVAFEVVFTATLRNQTAPIAGIGRAITISDDEAATAMCTEAPFYLFQDMNLLILKARMAGDSANKCSSIIMANIEAIPVETPISIIVSTVVSGGWRNFTMSINGQSISVPRLIKASILPMGVADLDVPLSAGIANPTGDRWQGAIHYMGVYINAHINGATARGNTATLLPLQPPLFSASLRNNGLKADELSTSVVPIRGPDAFTVHPDAALTLSLTSATDKFWQCFNVSAVRDGGAAAAETLTSSAALPFPVADKTSLTFRAIGTYTECADAAKELAVMAQVTLPQTSARAATTQTAPLLSAPWSAPRAIPFAVRDASNPVTLSSTESMTARSAQWLAPLEGANADPSLMMTQATITTLPGPQFRLYTWNAERAASVGISYVEGSPENMRDIYLTPITTVPFVILPTDTFVPSEGVRDSGSVYKSIKLFLRHTTSSVAPTLPTAPSTVVATAAVSYTVKSENGRTSAPATVTVTADSWISCADSNIDVLPGVDVTVTANAVDLSTASSPGVTGPPLNVGMIITRLPTMGTLQVPISGAPMPAAAAAEAEAAGVRTSFAPLAAPADASATSAQRARLHRLLSLTRSASSASSAAAAAGALHELTGYAAHTAEMQRRGVITGAAAVPPAGPPTAGLRALTAADLPYATGNSIVYRPAEGVFSRLSAPATADFGYFVYDRNFMAPSKNSATASVTLLVVATAPQIYVQTSDRGAPPTHLTDSLTMPYSEEKTAMVISQPTLLNLTYADPDEGDTSARLVDITFQSPKIFGFAYTLTDAAWEALVINSNIGRSLVTFSVRLGNLQEALSAMRIELLVVPTEATTVRILMTATEYGEHGDSSTAQTSFYVHAEASKVSSSGGDFFTGIIFKLILFIAVPIVGIMILVALCKLLRRRICGAKTEAEKACDTANGQGETNDCEGETSAAALGAVSNKSKHMADGGSKKDGKKDAKKAAASSSSGKKDGKRRSPSVSESHASYVSPSAPGAASSSMSFSSHAQAAAAYYVSPAASKGVGLGLVCNTALPPYPGLGSNNSSPTHGSGGNAPVQRPMSQEELTATMAMLLQQHRHQQQLPGSSSGQFPADASSSASMSFSAGPGRSSFASSSGFYGHSGGYDGPVPEPLDERDAHASAAMHLQYTARPSAVPGSPGQSFGNVPGSPAGSIPDTPTAMRRSLKTGRVVYSKTYTKKKVARKL